MIQDMLLAQNRLAEADDTTSMEEIIKLGDTIIKELVGQGWAPLGDDDEKVATLIGRGVPMEAAMSEVYLTDEMGPGSLGLISVKSASRKHRESVGMLAEDVAKTYNAFHTLARKSDETISPAEVVTLLRDTLKRLPKGGGGSEIEIMVRRPARDAPVQWAAFP